MSEFWQGYIMGVCWLIVYAIFRRAIFQEVWVDKHELQRLRQGRMEIETELWNSMPGMTVFGERRGR